mgnify:CR=1 FL=1
MSSFNKVLFFACTALLTTVIIFVVRQETVLPDASIQSNEITKTAQTEKTVPPEIISDLMSQERPDNETGELFYQTLPGSLSDAPKPASLETDLQGNLIINKRVQHLFEFYLMAMGEEPFENIIARIKHDLSSQLNADAYLIANNLLEGYLQYRNNIGIIKNQYAEQATISGTSMALIKEIKLAIRDSRSAFLPDEAISSFYSKEDDYDDYMISKAQILNNKALSVEQKRVELILLDENTPIELIQAQNGMNQLSKVRNSVSDLRKLGANDEDIYLYREQELGTDVADRLASLDTERQVWQARVNTYRVELANIESMDAYSKDEKHRMIEALRNEHFDEQEILRVRTLDKMRTQNSKT